MGLCKAKSLTQYLWLANLMLAYIHILFLVQGVDNITSTHNQLYMWFKTDGSVAGQGFALSWTSPTPSMSVLYNVTI